MVENKRLKNVIFWLISQELIESQEDLAKKLGYHPAYISHILTGTKPLSDKFASKITEFCEKINPDYLSNGGEMIIGEKIQKIGSISGGAVGNIGEMHGDLHTNGGKDRAIVEQEKNVQYSLDVLTSELQKFHEQLERKDVYIKEIIYNNDIRHSEKDKRIEDLTTELIRITDKIIDVLNSKV